MNKREVGKTVTSVIVYAVVFVLGVWAAQWKWSTVVKRGEAGETVKAEPATVPVEKVAHYSVPLDDGKGRVEFINGPGGMRCAVLVSYTAGVLASTGIGVSCVLDKRGPAGMWEAIP